MNVTPLVEGPDWSVRGLDQKAGRYPLQVEAPVLRAVDLLVPGMSTLTRYVRYYALYAALAAHANDHDLDAAACRRLLRRSEAILAVVSRAHDQQDLWPGRAHGIDRVDSPSGDGFEIEPVAGTENKELSYSPRAWGFWAQYGGPSTILGTVFVADGALRPGEHSCPKAIRELFAPLFQAAHRDVITRSQVEPLRPLAMQADSPPEVPWLRELFTATHDGRHDADAWKPDDRRRRATLRMFARAVELYGDRPELSWEERVRSAVAFGGQVETDPVLSRVGQVLAWRGLLLRNYSVGAWRRLWAGLVRSIGAEGGETDRTRDELRAWLADKMDAIHLRDLLAQLPDTMNGRHPAPAERTLLEAAGPRDPLTNVKLLLLGGQRAAELRGETRTTYLGTQQDILNPLWVARLIDEFRNRPLRDLAVRLVDDMLAQSRRVALAKMRPDGAGRLMVFSRVHERNGRFYKTGDEGDGDIGLRLHQLADFAVQLRLVDFADDGTATVTPRGTALLEVGA